MRQARVQIDARTWRQFRAIVHRSGKTVPEVMGALIRNEVAQIETPPAKRTRNLAELAG